MPPSKKENEAYKEWQSTANMFMNDLTYIQVACGIEVGVRLIQTKPDNRIVSALKLRRAVLLPKRIDPELTANALERKKGFLKMLGYKEEQMADTAMPVVPFQYMALLLVPRKVFWKQYKILEQKYSAYLRPIVAPYPEGIFPSYDIAPKPGFGDKPLPTN